MAHSSAIDTLIELATTETDEAAKKLGLAIRACQDTEQRLTLLLQYRDDYHARFQANMAAGMTPQRYQNFRSFMDKLDTAISGQQQIVADAKSQVEAERGKWQQSERKRMSYGTLANRAEQQALRKENHRDQKLMDEYATRLANYKRS